MDVITMEATAYKELIRKIEKIADYVFKKESKPNEEEEIWLDNQEVANLLRISTKTLQRLRKENLISYSMLRGRCRYKLSEIERGLNEKIIVCDPHTLDEFLSLIHISEPTRQAEISYAVFCLKKKKKKRTEENN